MDEKRHVLNEAARSRHLAGSINDLEAAARIRELAEKCEARAVKPIRSRGRAAAASRDISMSFDRLASCAARTGER
jgi:hypothetical protein